MVGKHIAAVLGIRNTGDEGFNVSAIQGNLALVTDPSGNVMNFTGTAYDFPELKKDDEVVVQYFMPLHSSLPTRPFYLQLNVFSDGSTESSYVVKQAFNSTIELIEEPKWIDLELLGLYAVFFGIVGLILWGVRDHAVEKGLIGARKSTKKSTSANHSKGMKTRATKAASGQHENEWLRGTIADKSKAKKFS